MPNQKRVATYVEKGGVAKTTTAAHVAAAAAKNHDHQTLIIDLAGTQNDIAAHFGLADTIESHGDSIPISAVFSDQWDMISELDDVLDRMIYVTDEGVDIIPSDMGLEGADNNLASVPIEERYTKLHEFVDENLGMYDLIVLDLPGKSDNIAINGLVAAGNVLAPVKPGEFERNQLADIQDDLSAIRDEDLSDVNLPRGLTLTQVAVTMYQSQRNLQDEFVEHVTEEYSDLAAPQPVNQTENVLQVQSDGQTLLAADEEQLYRTGIRARNRYETLTADLLERLA